MLVDGKCECSSCRCCMFVSCMHPVAVLNAAFCMTCSLLMLVEDAIGDHMEEACCTTAATQQIFPQTPTQSLQQT